MLSEIQTLEVRLEIENEPVPVESERYRDIRIALSKSKYYLQKIKNGKIFEEEKIEEVLDKLTIDAAEIKKRRLMYME